MKLKAALDWLKAPFLNANVRAGSVAAAKLSDDERYINVPAFARTVSGELPFYERRYADGVHHFEAGDLEAAIGAVGEYLGATGGAELINPGKPFGLTDVHSYEDFEVRFGKLLDRKVEDWERNKTPYPRFLTWLENARPPTVSVRGKRMMFLLPQYIMNSKRFVECDFKDHLLDTAANAGADVEFFPTDRCSYPDISFDSAIAKAELEALSVRIAAFKPDAIVVDGNYIPSTESLNTTYLGGLKARFGFKVIVFIGDAWGSHWGAPADKWSEVGDIVFHFAPETPLAKEGKFPEKLCWDAYPVNEHNFFKDAERQFDISFVGTYASVLRPFWLTVALQIAKDQGLRHRLLPHKREANNALTMADYATVLRQSNMVLNFSTHIGTQKMMTGRTWQAMTAATVLLDEDDVFTPAYFVPFVHYMPFSTRDELAYAVRYFSQHSDKAERMGDAAAAFCFEHYSSEAIWSGLLGAAYSRTAQQAAPGPRSPSDGI